GSVDIGDYFDFAGFSTYTLEAWVNPGSSQPMWGGVIGKMKEGPDTGYVLALQASGLSAARQADMGGQNLSAAPPPAGKFTHLVLTFDGTTLRLYVDGTFAKANGQAVSIPTTDANLTIGQYGGWASCRAIVDEVAIYGDVLLDGRIQAHYAAGKPTR